MTAWTPEREADVRAIAERMEGEAGHLLRATLTALTDERARREAAERRMHEAMADRDSRHAADEARLSLYREAADKAEAERDEARAALAALREAAQPVVTSALVYDTEAPYGAYKALEAALSAAAPIAGRYRASVLREAKRICDDRGATAQDAGDLVGWQACTGCGHAIEALANAAEKGEGHE